MVARICDKVAGGGLVMDACAAEGIAPKTLRQWTLDDPAVRALFESARIDQVHSMAEEIIPISDGTDRAAAARIAAMVHAIKDVDDDDKDRILRSLSDVAVKRDRLRADSRKWFVSKIAPKLYGDKLAHVGPDGEGPVEVEHRGTITWGSTTVPL